MRNIVNQAYDKLYGNLSEERIKQIEDLANKLRANYFTGSVRGLDALAKDQGITIIDTDKVLGFRRVRTEKNGEKNKAYIVRRKGSFQKVMRYATAHEIGHELLNHDSEPYELKEEEAHYFAEKLTDINFFNWYLAEKINFIIDIFKKTPLALKAFYKSNKDIINKDLSIVEKLVKAQASHT